MPMDDKNILGRNKKEGVQASQIPSESSSASETSGVREGDNYNKHGGKTWKPKTEKERDELSDKLADKATSILAGIKMPFAKK